MVYGTDILMAEEFDWITFDEALLAEVTPAPVTAQRSPRWVRDEMIVALDFYLRHRPNIPDKASGEIEELSATLNQLPIHDAALRGEKFRNANGVYLRSYGQMLCSEVFRRRFFQP